MEMTAGLCLRVCSQEQFRIIARREAEQTDLIRQIFRHFHGAGADGAGAAQKNYILHLRFTIYDLRAG